MSENTDHSPVTELVTTIELTAVDAVAMIEEVAKEEYVAALKTELVQRLIAKRALSDESLRSVIRQHSRSRRFGRKAVGIPYSDNPEERRNAILAHFIRHQ